MIRGALIAAACLLLQGAGFAETIAPAAMPWPAANPNTQQAAPLAGFGNVVLTASALVVLVGLGLYFLKNGTLPFRPQTGAERKLHVRETRMLGSKQFLVVVEYEDSKLLLGVTPGKIDYLCALENRVPASTPFNEMLESGPEPKETGEKA